MPASAASESATTVAPPPAKAKPDDVRALVPALAGVAIVLVLGLGLVFLAWWGARFVRRRMGGPLGPSRPLTDEWYSKPLDVRPPPANDEESQLGS